MENPPSISSVVAALRDFGLRKAGTPLLIASTPVSAAHPEEKARASRNTIAKPDQCPGWPAPRRSKPAGPGAHPVAEEDPGKPPAQHHQDAEDEQVGGCCQKCT